MFVSKRSKHNPILVPDKDHFWEEFATFNLCPIKHRRKLFGFYRAISSVDVLQNPRQASIIGITESGDGVNFKDRRPFIAPKEAWEKFGCEDPRVTYFEGSFYIFYTALSEYPFNANGIKVAVAISKDLKKIKERHLVTPFNAKAMTLFPKRINGKIVVMFSYHTDSPPTKMVFAKLDKIEELWSGEFWKKWERDVEENVFDLKRSPYDHTEVGAPPILTKYGWLVVYSHIQNYFSSPDNAGKIFGIEALLLDIKNPQNIIGRTKGPLLVPEESYELSGYVPDVIFPTGAIVDKNTLAIYYGAADTTVCLMRVNLKDLILTMHYKHRDDLNFKRFSGNPIISPIPKNDWESQATFNPAAIYLEGKIHILYRAMSSDNTSTFGYASTKNGTDIAERLSLPVYIPREDFENKKSNNQFSGCEDPRITKIGKSIFICYTAFNSTGPWRVAISSIKEKDFIAHNWKWEKPFLITPPGFGDKDACLFSEKFSLGYFILHRIGDDICGDYLNSLDFGHESVKRCMRIIGPRMNTWDSAKVGISAPPIKTKYGWLLLYHGVSKGHSTYRVGCVLLDLKDPSIVLARSTEPIFSPEEQYEKEGIVKNVVFPCGMVVKKDLLYIYYGGADKVVGVASIKLNIILKVLVNSIKY